MAEVYCVVPARLASSRLARKMLLPIDGKAMIVRSLEQAQSANCFTGIICLTDSPEIAEVVEAENFDVILTGEADNGTDRIARNLHSLPGNYFVNLQGDEPLAPLENLRILARAIVQDSDCAHTLVFNEKPSSEELQNPHRVKLQLREADGLVIAAQRNLEPKHIRHERNWCLQQGLYAYSRDFLQKYVSLPVSGLELDLRHELLRDLLQCPLKAHKTRFHGISVDCAEDYHRVLESWDSRGQSYSFLDSKIDSRITTNTTETSAHSIEAI